MNVPFHTLRVSAVTKETAECASFELEVPAALAGAFSYKAGQHLTFRVPWDDFEITRCYSLSSAPGVDKTMRIAVKRVEGGRVSNWFNDHVHAGDTLQVSVPEGRFVLDPQTRATAPLCLFAGGSGITPVISLLKAALADTKRPVTLLYANQSAQATIYKEEIEQLVSAHPGRVALHLHYDDAAEFLTADAIDAVLEQPDIAEHYVCGPEPMMALVEQTLLNAGAKQELVYIERFVSPRDPDRQDEDATGESDLPAPAAFSLWVNGRSRTVAYTRGKTLLECAHDAGLNPSHSCKSGFCGSCMAHVKTGAVHMRTHEALSERDIARGVALLCQSVPSSDEPLELDADSTSFRAASAVKSSYSRRVSQLAVVGVFALMIAGTLVLRMVP